MIERLGNLLYWIGNVAAALWCALFLYAASISSSGSSMVVIAIIGAVVIWLIGRAALYLFAGR